MSREGPEVTLRATCSGCSHEVTEYYVCQSDTGFNDYCSHPDIISQSLLLSKRRMPGYLTPEWCPILDVAINAAKASL